MIVANKRDYRRGYKSVECGLKYKLLVQWREENPRRMLEGADEKKKDILKSHNLEKLLKELGQQGIFKFPQLETVHKDSVLSDAYHQLYRYCISLNEKGHKKEEKLEDTLKNELPGLLPGERSRNSAFWICWR